MPAVSRTDRRGTRRAIVACMAIAAGTAGAGEPRPPLLLADGYRLELVATDPDIVTPVGAACDDRGRLFVIESHTHFPPQGYAGPPHDRIRVVSDTDGDGRADRFTSFFEGTRHTMGLRFGADGWLYVVARGGVFRIRDADGDDVAETREPIARLETAGDYPHNGLGGLAFDQEGHLVFGLGENLGEPYAVVAADGSRRTGGGEGGSVFRCSADGRNLERVATGFWNPFGLGVDPAGRTFAVDNDPDGRPPCRLIHVVDTGDYGYQFRFGRSGRHPLQAWDGELPGTLPMAAGTGEAPCAVVPFAGGLWVTSWGHHRLERFSLAPRGASVSGTSTIVVQGDQFFRPVDIAPAPDGSAYVTDWVDRSYEVHGRGRIWRLVPPQAAADAWPERSAAERRGDGLTAAAAIDALGDPDPFVRQAAIARLVRDGPQAIPAPDELDSVAARVSALATLRWLAADGADVDVAATVRWALADPAEEVRLAAVRWIADARLADFAPDLRSLATAADTSPRMLAATAAAAAWLAGTGRGPDDTLLTTLWEDATRPDTLRAAALDLVPAGSAAVDVAAVAALAAGDSEPVARAATRLLALRNADDASRALESLATDISRPAAVRADAAAGLVRAGGDRSHLVARLADDSEPSVARVARLAGGVPDDTTSRPAGDDIPGWLRRVGEGGDADAGWRVFVGSGRCAACHSWGGRGPVVGPDLTGIVARQGRERVLASLLDPSREIGPGFQAYALELVDGRVLSGLSLASVDGGGRERFVGGDGREFTLDTAEIAHRQPLTTSIMPRGLEQTLDEEALRDLLAFLSADRP